MDSGNDISTTGRNDIISTTGRSDKQMLKKDGISRSFFSELLFMKKESSSDDDVDDDNGRSNKEEKQQQESTTTTSPLHNIMTMAGMVATSSTTNNKSETKLSTTSKLSASVSSDDDHDDDGIDLFEEDVEKASSMMMMKETTTSTGDHHNKKDDEIEDEDDDEGIEIPILNSDTFSFIAFVDYQSVSMLLLSMVILVQLSTVAILLVDIFSTGTSNNLLGVPPMVAPTTSAMQVLTLFITVVSQGDLQDSLNTLFIGYHKLDLEKQLNRQCSYWRWVTSATIRMIVAVVATVTTFFLIVGQSNPRDLLLDFTAIAFITNLDNITFELASLGYFGLEAQMDASAIILAKTRTLRVIPTEEPGDENDEKKDVDRYEDSADETKKKNSRRSNLMKRYTLATNESTMTIAANSFTGAANDDRDCDTNDYKDKSSFRGRLANAATTVVPNVFKPRQFPRTTVLVLMYVSLMLPWLYIFYRQRSGYYLCQSIFVQFSDEFSPEAATFSGLYEIGPRSNGRRNYRGVFNTGEAVIGYCPVETAWVFSHGDVANTDENIDICKEWKAKSVEIYPLTEESYNVMSTASQEWSVTDNRGWVVPLPYFSMQCYDCQYDDNFCGGPTQGTCVNNRCVCNDGWNGLRCEFPTFCDHVEVDIRYERFKGSREWSRSYDLLLTSTSPSTSSSPQDGEYGSTTINLKAVEVYNHPVFISEGQPFDVMFYNGRRWVIATSEVNDWFDRETLAHELTTNFHGYWSNYTVGFLSVNVDLDSPQSGSAIPDGLGWYPAIKQTTASETQAPDYTRPLETILICRSCNNETNPCNFEGICQADGVCSCTSGSSGSLCQVTPEGNGLCNTYFNTPEFGYDGGDCCEASCTSTADYTCGSEAIETAGVSAFSFVGFPNCEDPKYANEISGSKTLFEIVDRGVLRCGMSIKNPLVVVNEDGSYSGFEVDMCKAIAAAVLGDPELYEVVISTSKTRFTDLTDKKFDVLVRTTTHTAERDIYLGSSNSGFSFASIPYFYDGLRYAGIPQYTACADRLDHTSVECQNLKICIAETTSWYDVTKELFPDSVLVVPNTFDDGMVFFKEGLCNVISGETFDVMESNVRAAGYTGLEYSIGTNVFSKEPLAAMTRQDDRVWTKFVSWIFDALIYAEELGITDDELTTLVAPSGGEPFGKEFKEMFFHAVKAVGNYGQIYERHLEQFLPRGSLNRINNATTGLIYSYPFGNYDNYGPEPNPGGTIASIRNRGYLNCGISTYPGFAAFDSATSSWQGFDVDLCRGIAAAIFNGDESKVQFSPFLFPQRFPALSSGAVDVLAAVTSHTLEREVNEPLSGEKSFEFSTAYHHAGLGFAGPLPFSKCADELNFSNNTSDNSGDSNCAATRICVAEGTTHLDAMQGPLGIAETNIVVVANQEDVYDKLIRGECNVIAGESSAISESTVVDKGYNIDLVEFYVGLPRHTKEPIALVTRSDDDQFSDFIRWILFGHFYAEEQDITQQSAFQMPITHLFGDSLNDMWSHSVAAVGNFGEIFDRNFDALLERNGQNKLNTEGDPQLLSKPMGGSGVFMKKS